MTKKSNKADRKPTWTSLTVQALQARDDFMTLPQLVAVTGANPSQMGAALHHLKQHGVVEALQAEGGLWWFLTGKDTRSREVGERVPEPEGNRTRATGVYYRRKKPKPE